MWYRADPQERQIEILQHSGSTRANLNRERWILRKRDTQSIRADQISDDKIWAEIGIYNMNNRIRQASLKWKQHNIEVNSRLLYTAWNQIYTSRKMRCVWVAPQEGGRIEDGTGCKRRE